ncbi:MAG TPA: mandelate racemase/muconate lactonizing enzyme family protein [Burkholderiales bacterium]|nr:mandelate racemase/muconate lactonizing enzyme family protein [Burkholderiales bacterium]
MRLAQWSLEFYRLPYRREVVWANARESAGLYALLALTADDGRRGVAEGTLKATWSGVSPRSLRAALEDFLIPALRDAPLDDPAAVAAAFAGIPENRLAKGLVESACWMLRAAREGEPLWRLLGAGPRVPLAYTVTRQKPALMATESAAACRQYGFRNLKVKGGQGVAADLQALKEIRAAVGDGVELTVDANGAYARDEAEAYVRALADAGVAAAEDPCRLEPDARFERLQASSPIPILVDRSCASREDAALYLERGAKALSAKPGRVGLNEARAVARLAAQHGAKSAIGIYAESALGTLINLQQPGTMAAEQTFFLMLTDQVTTWVPDIREGYVALPEEPDLARLVDREVVKRFAISS